MKSQQEIIAYLNKYFEKNTEYLKYTVDETKFLELRGQIVGMILLTYNTRIIDGATYDQYMNKLVVIKKPHWKIGQRLRLNAFNRKKFHGEFKEPEQNVKIKIILQNKLIVEKENGKEIEIKAEVVKTIFKRRLEWQGEEERNHPTVNQNQM